MKKFIYTLSVLSLSVFSAFSQTFSPEPRTVNSSGNSFGSRDLICNVKNNSTNIADSMFKWTVIANDLSLSWDLSVCDPNNCYPAFQVTEGSSHVCQIDAGTTGQFKATYTFNAIGGTNTTKIYLENYRRNMANSEDSVTSSDTVTFIANAWITGVNEVNRAADIKLYPNPAKDLLNFKYSSTSPVSVDIYNILGVKVKSFVHEGNTTQVNIADLQNGIYFVRLKGFGSVYSKSFTKSE